MAKYREPTQEQVEEALRRIPTVHLRRAFFEGLKNPTWVEPLARQRAFGNPPEPEVMPDGAIRDHYWPEIDYLARVAPDAPGAVVDVLLKLKQSRNAWVRRNVFTIGASVPADEAVRLRPLIENWIGTGAGVGWRTDPRDLVGFAVNLLSGGQFDAGLWFANHLFKPKREQRDSNRGLPIEDFWYEHEIHRVVAVLGERGLTIVLAWLVAYERTRGRLRKNGDITFVSRDLIRTRNEFGEPVEQVLIDTVRDLAVDGMRRVAGQVKSALIGTGMIVARKIALFALAEAVSQAVCDQQSMQAASELLFDQKSFDDSCRIEYGELARAVAKHNSELLDQLPAAMESGLRLDDDRLRDWFALADDGRSVDERMRDYEDRRWHRWLSSIGGEALPELLRTRLAALDARYGVIDSPLAVERQIMSWSGPNSPITQEEMSMMSPLELMAHLETWHDIGDGWGPEPSHEGQGRQLSALLTTNPNALNGVERLTSRLRPIYLRSILQGWEAALKANMDLNWSLTAEIIRDVLTHDDESGFPVEGGKFDDDPDFRYAKKAAVGLLEELVKNRDSDKVPTGMLSTFADMLITLADDEKAWVEYIETDQLGGMDALTLSLNYQWPVRIRGIVHLLTFGPSSSWFTLAGSALERELAREDIRGASMAVVGESLGRIFSSVPEWTESRLSNWFGDEAGISASQQIALTTAMAVHRYHPKLYDLLTPSMIAALEPGIPIAVGWVHGQSDPLQRIGEWVVSALIMGHTRVEDDRLASAFFTRATAKIRGSAMGSIAWSFMHAERVDESIRDNLGRLWESRLAHVRSKLEDRDELNGFYWFVKSGKFAVEWWLPHLRDALELNSNFGRERYFIGDEMAAAAAVDARSSLEVVKLLLKDRDDADMSGYDLFSKAVPLVIARGLISDDVDLQDAARRYMNELGERGHIGLEAEVAGLIRRGFSSEEGPVV